MARADSLGAVTGGDIEEGETMNILGALIGAFQAGFQTFRTLIGNPEDTGGVIMSHNRRARYALLWNYYTNQIFEQFSFWREYIDQFRLYRNVRSIYNPYGRLVDFYVGSVYPGRLTIDAGNLPDGIPNAIPFSADTSDQLKAAVGQIWQWSNWQTKKNLMIRFAASVGDCLVEVVDDVERQKVYNKVTWPGLVDEIELNDAGDVVYYSLQYVAADDDGHEYEYRKETGKDYIRTYRDGNLTGFDGFAAERPNYYGFIPAVWVRHKDVGGDFGAPVMGYSIGKIDELNSIMTHLHDHIHKTIENPFILWSNGEILPAFAADARLTGDADDDDPDAREQDLMFLKGPQDGAVDTLAGTIDLAEALDAAAKLIAEIEHDNPELVMYDQLRTMQQVTGPGANRMVGDTYAKLEESASGYDMQSIKLFQMSVAIAGENLRRGYWRNPTAAQRKFDGFDLQSYERGDLGMEILPRPVVPVTAGDQIALQQSRATLANAVQNHVSGNETLRILNYSKTDAARIQREKNTLDPAAEAVPQ
jgi:hypothetical protein